MDRERKNKKEHKSVLRAGVGRSASSAVLRILFIISFIIFAVLDCLLVILSVCIKCNFYWQLNLMDGKGEILQVERGRKIRDKRNEN